MIDASAQIHSTAIIEDGAIVGAKCKIGAYAFVGANVTLAENVELMHHAIVGGITTIGSGTRIWSFASVGSEPQDLKYKGEPTRLEIGRNNTIREFVTISTGTAGGGGITRVGDGNLFMNYVHVGHDCQVGNNIIFANSVQVAGHVIIADNVVLGSMSGLHQFCRVGTGAMIGAGAIVVNDVIPYATVMSIRATLGGLNLIGLKRRGADKAHMNALRKTYKELFNGDQPLLDTARELQTGLEDSPLAQDVLEFVLANSDRSFCLPD